MGYVYVKSEPGLWTVGFYSPDGGWNPERDFLFADEAAARVAWLNGGGPAKTPKAPRTAAKPKVDVDPDFDRFKRVYPKRAGAQRWPDAMRFWNTNIKNGVTAEEMIEGALRYRTMIATTLKEGTEYVQQAASFLGRNQGWKEEWVARVVSTPAQRAESEMDKYDRIAQATRRGWAST